MPPPARLVHRVLDDYDLPWFDVHGVAHWARVLENGRRLAEATGADVRVVELFAVFHDARRVNEGTDPDHGRRGADYAAALRGTLFELPDAAFAWLYEACAGHTDGQTDAEKTTIQTCWDADRLDLGRVGIAPDPSRLCTDAAKRKETIRWADARAGELVVPRLVRDDWGIVVPDRYVQSPRPD